MKNLLIRNLFAPNTKSTDDHLRKFRAACIKIAKANDAKITIGIQRDGGVNVALDNVAVEEIIRTKLAKVKGVTVTEVSNPLDVFLEDAVSAGKLELEEAGS